MSYIDMTEDLLSEVEQFAYVYLSRPEIAIVTGVDIELLRDQDHPAGRAFLKGRLMRKAEFNGAVIKLTKQLSSPAMAIESKIAETAQLNDMKKR